MKKLRAAFRELPVALQKQVLIRGTLGLSALLFSVIILIYTGELYFSLPCIILSIFMIVNGSLLLYNCFRGKYVTVEGDCAAVEKTAIRKRVKAIGINVDGKMLTVTVRRKLRAPGTGDRIKVYLPVNEPVYERDGGYYIYGYYTLEIKRKV